MYKIHSIVFQHFILIKNDLLSQRLITIRQLRTVKPLLVDNDGAIFSGIKPLYSGYFWKV